MQSWKGLTSTCITTWITKWRTDHLHNQNISNSQNFGRRVLHPWCPVKLYHCLHLQYVYLPTVFFFPSCSWIIWNLWQGRVLRQLCAPESMSILIASNNTLKSPNFHLHVSVTVQTPFVIHQGKNLSRKEVPDSQHLTTTWSIYLLVVCVAAVNYGDHLKSLICSLLIYEPDQSASAIISAHQ